MGKRAKDHRAFKKTAFPGVIFREHATRRHGVKFDQYFVIYFRHNGKTYKEAVGWASHGWTAKKAAGLLSELKENQRRGERPFTLKDKRALAQAAIDQAERRELTITELFKTHYLPHGKAEKKSWAKDEYLFRLHIEPVIGAKALSDVSAFDLERLKAAMSKTDKAPKTILYALGTVRAAYNYAARHGLFTGKNPVSLVKKPSADNRRMRFLTEGEAQELLDTLRAKSTQTYEMALVSLHTGGRFAEIAALTWADVNIDQGTLTFWDTKNTETRTVFMTQEVKILFQGKTPGTRRDLVFPARTGERMAQVSSLFNRTVNEMFNQGITDRRQRVCFHTLRHTHASWLVQRGNDLLTVARIMGHKSVKMVERYAHLAPEGMRRAVQTLNGTLTAPEATKGKVVAIRPMP